MPLPSKPFGDWTKEDLDLLVTDPPAVEGPRIDFKAQCGLLSSDKPVKEKARRDILVDVASMANGVGGALLIGVRENGDAAGPPVAAKIEGIHEPERLQQAIEGLVNTHLDVRPGAFEYHVVAYEDDRSVLVVDVPANTYSLSMVTYGDLHQFWVRRGRDNQRMTTDEIEFKMGQFAKVRDSVSEELEQIRERMERSAIKPMVWFAGVPLSRARDHVPVRVGEISKLMAESSYFSMQPTRKDLHGWAPGRYRTDVVPSLNGIGMREDYRGFVTFDLGRDGGLVYGHELRAKTHDTTRVGADGREEELVTIAMSGVYEVLQSALCLFADVQSRFGIGKLAAVQAGLIDVRSKVPVTGPYPPHRSPMFRETNALLDAIFLDEHWSPEDVFEQWALQIANACELEEPIFCPPWVGG